MSSTVILFDGFFQFQFFLFCFFPLFFFTKLESRRIFTLFFLRFISIVCHVSKLFMAENMFFLISFVCKMRKIDSKLKINWTNNRLYKLRWKMSRLKRYRWMWADEMKLLPCDDEYIVVTPGRSQLMSLWKWYQARECLQQ